jgi:hypothetical protein
MATRKLNALELSIHQTAIASPEKARVLSNEIIALHCLTTCMQTLSQKELVALAPDVAARTEALNFLLGTVSI